MYIESGEVDRYGPLYDVRPALTEGLTVLSGPNEAGKTLYLEALLQLLEPSVREVMTPEPRVDQKPTGRVELRQGGEHYVCAGETSLAAIVGIDPTHLQRLFVVRDSDLALPTDPSYYTSLIETLGDIHTSDIETIQAELRDRGRLTPTRLDISSDQTADNAGKVHDEAESLAADIRAFLADADATVMDGLTGKRVRLKSELSDASERLEAQRDARRVAEHDRLMGYLETVRETRQELDTLSAVSRDTLEALREQRTEREREQQALESVADRIEATEARIGTLQSDISDLEATVAEFEGRESAVGTLRRSLDAFRSKRESEPGARRQLHLAKRAALIGLGGAAGTGILGGLSGSLPVVSFGAVLGAIALGAGGVYYRANSRLEAVERARSSLVADARDAGFEVGGVEEIAPAIESFRQELERTRERTAKRVQALETARERRSDLLDRKADHETRVNELTAAIEDTVQAVDVDSIEGYERRVSRREDLETERQTARQQLIDRFGEPTGPPAEQEQAWEVRIDGLLKDVERDIERAAYDEAEREALETEVDSLEAELDELEARLEAYDDQLAAFDRRARALETRPFIDRQLELPSHTADGLNALATALETVVDRIERDAERSRKAHDLFDRIDAQEQQKLADLFDPAGPASKIFERLTGGRYTAVSYDPEGHSLSITRQDGRTVEPAVLSKATTDQLYFATRVSLAGQLLGNEPGFLLLDDPFLAADPERLRRGFRSLLELVDDGWQILYFTAKGEVSETMVEEFDLERTAIGVSPLSTEP